MLYSQLNVSKSADVAISYRFSSIVISNYFSPISYLILRHVLTLRSPPHVTEEKGQAGVLGVVDIFSNRKKAVHVYYRDEIAFPRIKISVLLTICHTYDMKVQQLGEFGLASNSKFLFSSPNPSLQGGDCQQVHETLMSSQISFHFCVAMQMCSLNVLLELFVTSADKVLTQIY